MGTEDNNDNEQEEVGGEDFDGGEEFLELGSKTMALAGKTQRETVHRDWMRGKRMFLQKNLNSVMIISSMIGLQGTIVEELKRQNDYTIQDYAVYNKETCETLYNPAHSFKKQSDNFKNECKCLQLKLAQTLYNDLWSLMSGFKAQFSGMEVVECGERGRWETEKQERKEELKQLQRAKKEHDALKAEAEAQKDQAELRAIDDFVAASEMGALLLGKQIINDRFICRTIYLSSGKEDKGCPDRITEEHLKVAKEKYLEESGKEESGKGKDLHWEQDIKPLAWGVASGRFFEYEKLFKKNQEKGQSPIPPTVRCFLKKYTTVNYCCPHKCTNCGDTG